jgi:hypothetical protein
MNQTSRPTTIYLLIGFLLLLAPVAGAQNVLDMTVSPPTLGWGPVTSGGATLSLASNVLTIDSPLNGFGGYGAPSAAWNAAVGNPAGWEVECRVRLTDQLETSQPAQGGLMLSIGTGAHLFYFEIFTDHIALTNGSYTGTISHTMDTQSAYHTYIITGLGANIDVSVDNAPALNATNLGTSTQEHLQFGDLLYANHTVSDWTYVAFGEYGAVQTENARWGGVKALFRD